ncbi:MAG TPA: crotonase/enoyl-CoA hydratase family protein [Labilithrix sp.]|nr:crotonase/enoyl-CoA hydratase family protein [Labilithrix sp.]
MTTTYESLRVERADGIAEVCLIGPGKGNAMGQAFFRELPELFHTLDRDEAVRVVIVRGDKGIFSYGLDLKAMGPALMPHLAPGNLASERARLLDLIGDMQSGFDAMERCRKPVIAAIAGPCIGGGVDLISACDLRIAARGAIFSVREAKVAIVADMGSLARLPRIIGHGHTRELAFTGKDIDAERALRIGLVNDLFDDEATLLAGARKLAREIADNPSVVVQGIKHVLDFGEGATVAEANRFVAVWNAAFLASADLGEAIQAFAERRPPKFTR